MNEHEAIEKGLELLKDHNDWIKHAREAEPCMELRVVRVLVYQGPVEGVLAQLGRSLSPGVRDCGAHGTITVVQGKSELTAARVPVPTPAPPPVGEWEQATCLNAAIVVRTYDQPSIAQALLSAAGIDATTLAIGEADGGIAEYDAKVLRPLFADDRDVDGQNVDDQDVDDKDDHG